MDHARAERQVVADLRRVAEEVVVVELEPVAHDAAADLHAVLRVAVAVDDGLDERVVGVRAGHRRRDA